MTVTNPLDAIREWHRKLPPRLAGLVAERVISSLPDFSLDNSLQEDAVRKKFDDWLMEESEIPYQTVARAAMFRAIVEIFLGREFTKQGWEKRKELIEGFVHRFGPTKFTEQTLQEHEFYAAQWISERENWTNLVESHLSDEVLRQYLDHVFRLSLPSDLEPQDRE